LAEAKKGDSIIPLWGRERAAGHTEEGKEKEGRGLFAYCPGEKKK